MAQFCGLWNMLVTLYKVLQHPHACIDTQSNQNGNFPGRETRRYLSLDPRESHLWWKLELVVVVVGRQVDVFVDTVQQPKQELQSVMLRITPKLAAIFGNYGLEREGEGGVEEEEEEEM